METNYLNSKFEKIKNENKLLKFPILKNKELNF